MACSTLRSLLLAALCIAAGAGSASADATAMRAPHLGSARRTPLAVSTAPDYLAIVRQPPAAAGASPFTALLEVYRRVISPVDGDRCDMAPTCSLYAQQAFKEHGVTMGFLLTADRLLHEADERPHVRSYRVGKEKYYIDPIAANTYWLPAWMQ
jgi:hypothetical protein